MLEIFVNPYNGKKHIISRTAQAVKPLVEAENVETYALPYEKKSTIFSNLTNIFTVPLNLLIEGVQAFGAFCSAVQHGVMDICHTQQARDIGAKCGLVNRIEEYSDWDEEKQKKVHDAITKFMEKEEVSKIFFGEKYSDAVIILQKIKIAVTKAEPSSEDLINPLNEAIGLFAISNRDWESNMGVLVPLVKNIKSNFNNLDLLNLDDSEPAAPSENDVTPGGDLLGE